MEGQQLSQQDHLKEKIRIELEFVRRGVIIILTFGDGLVSILQEVPDRGNELVVPGFEMILCAAAINYTWLAFIKLIKRPVLNGKFVDIITYVCAPLLFAGMMTVFIVVTYADQIIKWQGKRKKKKAQ